MSPTNVAVIGAGYVGLCTAVAFCERGHKVTCVDVVPRKVELVNQGKSPVYEKGLEGLLAKHVKSGALKATKDLPSALKDTEFVFLCVQTPSNPDGTMDSRYIEVAARGVGKALAGVPGYVVVVVKSTVVPGTASEVVLPALEGRDTWRLAGHLRSVLGLPDGSEGAEEEETAGPVPPPSALEGSSASALQAGKKVDVDFGLVSNPEFLKEGSALQDALHPDRVVIGAHDKKAADAMLGLYAQFDCPKLIMDNTSAEMVKYVANAFLATKITFANEMALVCEKFGVDVYEVMKAVGLDQRINPHFLNAGCGFGGSCFPKDVRALFAAAKSRGHRPRLLETVLDINDKQPRHAIDLLTDVLGRNLKERRIALLGLTFKPGTDDVRETRALPIAMDLIKAGAKVVAYDPVGTDNFRKLIPEKVWDRIEFAPSAKDALSGSEAVVLQADWPEFRALTAGDFKSAMRKPIVIDGRRTCDPTALSQAGVIYKGIGWKNR